MHAYMCAHMHTPGVFGGREEMWRALQWPHTDRDGLQCAAAVLRGAEGDVEWAGEREPFFQQQYLPLAMACFQEGSVEEAAVQDHRVHCFCAQYLMVLRTQSQQMVWWMMNDDVHSSRCD